MGKCQTRVLVGNLEEVAHQIDRHAVVAAVRQVFGDEFGIEAVEEIGDFDAQALRDLKQPSCAHPRFAPVSYF